MICRVHGEVIAVRSGVVELRADPLVYELLVPACDEMRLAASAGERITFHTLHYLESHAQGASFVPRLVGFSSRSDLEFFKLLTTVKGIGTRKALRALQRSIPDVAAAIAARDIGTLTSLPEIGRKTAESIVHELRDKVAGFAETPGAAAGNGVAGRADTLIDEAVSVLTLLGEVRAAARQLVDRALAHQPDLDSAEELVTAALRQKQ